jgi:quercetin dioxygenase-like cupin family protein
MRKRLCRLLMEGSSVCSATDPARARGARVTFEACARTAWHTHPLGQTLIVTSGIGRVQRWGGPIEEIRPGDVISIAPGEKHWHGASPTVAMTHIAIQEALNGNVVERMERSATKITKAGRHHGKASVDEGLDAALGGNNSREHKWTVTVEMFPPLQIVREAEPSTHRKKKM